MTVKLFSFLAPSFSSSSILSLLLLVLFMSVQYMGSDAQTTSRAKKPPAPALIVFGDSIVDPGNNNWLITMVKCNFAPYGKDFAQQKPTGRFCNGKVPSDMIASSFGIKDLIPAYLDPNLTREDLLTGVSFASGGSGYDSLTPKLVGALSMSDQLELFKQYKEKLKRIAGEKRAAAIVSDSVYLSVTGTDDIANTYFTTPFRREQYDISSYTDLIANSAANFYQELYQMGARKILAVGLPPVGCIPSQRTLAGGIDRQCVELYNRVAKMVNSKIAKKIQMLSANLSDPKMIYVDIYSILDKLIQRPTDYGFEVSNKGCCGTGNIEVALLCNPLSPPCEDVSKYVFWDSYHPSERAYKIMTDALVRKYRSRIL